ncbi:hypothetical protein [Planococcus sp. YIM B11945]|uniref:hypothetical protein n=1 Tax=Planococcus sp. YIM B11945 TaxID=3435410 RepID=UPI003D7DF59D
MNNTKDGKISLFLFTEGSRRNITRVKSSNEIVESLKNKGIHAEVCKRHDRQSWK